MNNAKHSCIEAYLSEHFAGSKIEQKHDFDLLAQSFKVHLPDDSLLLKVSDIFVSDNDEAHITPSQGRSRIFPLAQRCDVLYRTGLHRRMQSTIRWTIFMPKR